MLQAIGGESGDYTPCSFMLFFSLYRTCRTELSFVSRQVEMGLDAFVHVGHLNHTLHGYGALSPEVKVDEWVEASDGARVFCRRLETPRGPLTAKVKQVDRWPTKKDFPLMKDWLVPRSGEFLIKPEEDLERLGYVLGPFKDADIHALKEEAAAARKIAEKHGLLQVGGYKGYTKPGPSGVQVDPGVMGCDAMAWLSGFETIMVLSLTRPEIVREYAQIIHQWNLKQIGIYLDVTAADLIIRRGWYETTEFWTPEAWRQIILPTLEAEGRLIHQAGKKFGYIVTSAYLPLLDDIFASGVDVLIGVDPCEGKGTDLSAVKSKAAAKKKALWGGVSGPLTIEQGSAEGIECAVRSALSVLGKGGGFILSPVDNVSENSARTRRNVQEFIGSWKKLRSQCG